MKRLALILAVLALVAPSVAQAHSYYHNKPGMATRLEGRINAFRVNHHRSFLLPGFSNFAAVIALQKANYAEHRWTLSIAGVPYPVWSQDLFSGGSVMLSSIRPHGAPWTPYMVMKRWKHKPAYRKALLGPWVTIGTRAGYVHQHRGAYHGKGRCTVYYISMSFA